MTRLYNRLAISIIAPLIIVFRDPSLFIAPRFWAEEGAFWFAYAFSHNWIDTIFSAFCGYYNFYPHIAALLASRIVPLEYAPVVTTVMAFIVQVIPVMIIVWDDSILWNSSLKKITWTAIILLAPESSAIWLNTNGSQYYLSLITILILLADTGLGSLFKKYFYRMLVMIAGLSGVLSCLITPFFFFKAWRTKNHENFIQAGILFVCSLVQLSIVFSTQHPDRLNHPDLATVALIVLVRNFIAPFSISLASQFRTFLLNFYNNSIFSMIGYGALITEIMVLWYFKRKISDKKSILIIGSFLLLTFFSTYFAIAGKNGMALLNARVGNRYYYTTNVLVLVMIFLSIDFQSRRFTHIVTSGLSIILLAIALIQGGSIFINGKLKKENWPIWRKEIVIWKKNPSYKPKIWPTGWRVILKKKK